MGDAADDAERRADQEREEEGITATQPRDNYPAECIVHWPNGPVACCQPHAEQLIGLGNFLGSHIVATALTPLEKAANLQCVNCLNEGPPKEEQS